MGAILGHLGSKLRLEADLAIFGRPWKGQDGAKMGPMGAKMGQVGAKMVGCCGQEAPRSTQEGLLGAMLGAPWPIWGAFWGHLAEKAAKQKTSKNLRFSYVLATLGVSRWGSSGILEVMLANVGFKFGFYAPFSGDVGASWRQDGEQDGQDGGQKRQDKPRWANLDRESH